MKYSGQDGCSLTEEAVSWVVRLEEDAGPEEHDACLRWLVQSPAHVAALLDAMIFFRRLDGFDFHRRIDVERLLKKTQNVVSIPTRFDAVHATHLTPVFKRTRIRRLMSCAAIVAAILVVPLSIEISRADPIEYRSTLGEQRSVVLPDGSAVTLNTASRISVRYSSDMRDIDLIAGEALFSVAHGDHRSFRVASGRALIVDVGTTFSVRRDILASTVVVTEGHVRVIGNRLHRNESGLTAGVPATELRKGDRWIVANAALEALRPVEHLSDRELAAQTLWTDGRLSFDHATVAAVADQFNRYNARKLVVVDQSVGASVVSVQSYANTDPMLFARSLESAGIAKLSASTDVASNDPIFLHAPIGKARHAP
ncbi:MAG: FecR domain-containing protein [Gammaproteobacteria bacterium]